MSASTTAQDAEIKIQAGGVRLGGHLLVPAGAGGIVVFVHGSGSSRHSPRNRFVGRALREAGFGTLLFDLLTPDEELDRANVFDIRLLAGRLAEVTRWLRGTEEARHAGFGFFGASTGAAAALWTAADVDADVDAIVSRGGRPDLAMPRLAEVRAPTLLIIGSRDDTVLELNRAAQARLRCESELAIVEGATHLFEEPGALEAVADLARAWFVEHLLTRSSGPTSLAIVREGERHPGSKRDGVAHGAFDPTLARGHDQDSEAHGHARVPSAERLGAHGPRTAAVRGPGAIEGGCRAGHHAAIDVTDGPSASVAPATTVSVEARTEHGPAHRKRTSDVRVPARHDRRAGADVASSGVARMRGRSQ